MFVCWPGTDLLREKMMLTNEFIVLTINYQLFVKTAEKKESSYAFLKFAPCLCSLTRCNRCLRRIQQVQWQRGCLRCFRVGLLAVWPHANRTDFFHMATGRFTVGLTVIRGGSISVRARKLKGK